MCLRLTARRVALAALLTATLPDLAAAQTSADVFDARQLHEIRLFIHSSDLRELREDYQGNTYYPADLEWRNVRVRNVGVRSRGYGSRSGTKLGLRVDFDHYTTGQQFVGLEALVLDNLWQDPSMMKERLAMAFFERMGQPAPRESFCRLYINNVYQGLYGVVEEIDGPFLARTIGERSGYLFEYRWVRPYYGTDLGDELAAYAELFEPRTRELEAPGPLYLPIRGLFGEAGRLDDPAWRDNVDAYIDLAQLVTQTAIEAFLSELDGLLGYDGMNNFYLYRGAGSTRHRVFPWDKDNAFYWVESPVMLRTDENVLIGGALAHADLRSLYLDVLEARAVGRRRALARGGDRAHVAGDRRGGPGRSPQAVHERGLRRGGGAPSGLRAPAARLRGRRRRPEPPPVLTVPSGARSPEPGARSLIRFRSLSARPAQPPG
jgi:spore coat protein CotH